MVLYKHLPSVAQYPQRLYYIFYTNADTAYAEAVAAGMPSTLVDAGYFADKGNLAGFYDDGQYGDILGLDLGKPDRRELYGLLSTLCHESIHAAMYLLRRVDQEFWQKNNEEALTYLAQYIFEAGKEMILTSRKKIRARL